MFRPELQFSCPDTSLAEAVKAGETTFNSPSNMWTLQLSLNEGECDGKIPPDDRSEGICPKTR